MFLLNLTLYMAVIWRPQGLIALRKTLLMLNVNASRCGTHRCLEHRLLSRLA